MSSQRATPSPVLLWLAALAGCWVGGPGGGGGGLMTLGPTPTAPAPQAAEANLVVALEAEPHPDVAAAFLDVDALVLDDGVRRETVPVGAVLPVDLAALAGDQALLTAARVRAAPFREVTLRLNGLQVVDSAGHTVSVQLGAVAPIVSLARPLDTAQGATLALRLNLDRDLQVDAVQGVATWTPAIDATAATTATVGSGTTLRLRLAGGLVSDTTPASTRCRVAVDPARSVAIPIELSGPFLAETWRGRSVVQDGAAFLRDEVVAGTALEFDGPFLPGGFEARPTGVVAAGGMSRIVRTGWDPVLRGVVVAVGPAEAWLDLFVLTTEGPGSPPAFSTVRVTSLAGGRLPWHARDAGDPAVLAPGCEVLANTYPRGEAFAADRVEVRRTVLFVERGSGTVVRVAGVPPSRLGLEPWVLPRDGAAPEAGPGTLEAVVARPAEAGRLTVVRDLPTRARRRGP